MKKGAFKIIRHAILMVGRTIKSYGLLSVTIVLSFSLLLGYLVYTDTASYNKYKHIFSKDRNVVYLYAPSGNEKKVKALLQQTSQMKNTYQYIQYEAPAFIIPWHKGIFEDGKILSYASAQIRCIPNHAWRLYDYKGFEREITYLDGKEHEGCVLNAGEALMDETTFCLLGLDKMEEPVYNLKLYSERGGDFVGDKETLSVIIPIRVVGTFSNLTDYQLVEEDKKGIVHLTYDVEIYLSLEDLDINDYSEFNWQQRLYFYSETPELITQAADRLSTLSTLTLDDGRSWVTKDFEAMSVYSEQDEALEQMKIEARTKAIITAALLLLLGINLYSSFTNALNDRKFEIGVKRAVGANSWEIIRQFLYESIIVMMANIVLSIALVTNIFIIWKFIYEFKPNEWGYYKELIIYVSPYSIAMFAICTVTLTVVFSLVFAYKSTQVEIVQYLKAE